jgi:hypothetical protein
VRIGHLVETDEQWTLSCSELVGVGVVEGLTPGYDPLVVARAGSLGQEALWLDLRAWTGVEPRDLVSSTARGPR